jgi:nucleotide-binding universal stress UspA family protein
MYKRILAALDGSHSAHLALEDALQLARADDATVMVASVVEPSFPVYDPVVGISETEASHVAAQKAAQQELDRARELCALREVRAVTQIIDAHGASVPSAILQAAQAFEADLIVLGTHGRRGVRRHLLGSVAETVLRSSCVPVLVVRDDALDDALAICQ